MYSMLQQRAPCVRSEGAHTYKKRKDEKRGGGGHRLDGVSQWSRQVIS